MMSLKIGGKTFLVIFEAFMVLLALAFVGGGILMWQLNKGPIEVSFARAFIENELSDPSHNISINVGQVFLDWAALEARPQVTLKDVHAIDTKTGNAILTVKSAAVSMARTSLLLGHVEPRTIMIDKPLLTVIRDEDGGFRFAFEQDGGPQAKIDFNKQSDILFALMDTLSKPRREIPPSWPVRSLETVVISGAEMAVEDHVLQQNWSVPRVDLAFRRGDRSLVTTAALWLENPQDSAPTLKAEAAYLGDSRSIAMDIAVNHLRAPFLAAKFPDLNWLKDQNVTLDGQAKARVGEGLALSRMEAQLQSRDGQIIIPDVYDQPLPYKELALDMTYDDAVKTFALRDSTIVFADDFKTDISGSIVKNPDGGLKAPLNIHIDSLPQSRVAQFWPGMLKGDSSEEWALHRLSGGRVYDTAIDLVLDAHKQPVDAQMPQGEQKWSAGLSALKASFFIDDMTVDYSPPLMPIRNADGQGEYDYATDRLDIDVQSGLLGDMKVESGKVVIDTVTGASVGHAAIDAHLKGPLKTVFQYISDKPINVGRNIGTDIAKIEGMADLQINVSFPTLAVLPAEKIKVTASGTASDILLPGLVTGLDVSGGPMDISVKDERLDVKGKAKLDGRDMNFTFSQFFESKDKPFAMQVAGDILADPDLRRKFGLDLSDWMEGTAPAKIVYTEFPDKRTEVDAVVDATPAVLMIKPMSYVKAAGVPASASAKAILQGGMLKEIRNLKVETPEARVEEGQMKFSQSGKETLLRSGEFPKARLNETDVSIKFDITPENVVA
ncbi:MAG TPA: DUF3971 domain-containing protein, partial [Micavibrio sp.]